MRVGSNGIVVNERGQVLLIRRDDSRTYAPPGGAVEPGELPTETLAREVREETGLIVMPVRLVGVFFSTLWRPGLLTFTFRAIQRGGKLAASAESLEVGFFESGALPWPMAASHRERVQRSLGHQGGPPYWGQQKLTAAERLGVFLLRSLVYPYRDWRRRLNGQARFVPAPVWRLSAYAVWLDDEGRLLCPTDDRWGRRSLPGGPVAANVAPWQALARELERTAGEEVILANLTGVYLHEGSSEMSLVFLAHGRQNQPEARPPAAADRLPLKLAQEELGFPERGYVDDALGPGGQATVFRRLTAPADKEL